MQVLTSLSGLPFSAVSAGFAPTNSADVSAIASAIASAYAESAASGKQDTLEFGYDANNLISSIDGSALAGQGGGGGVDSATVSAIASAYVESGVSSKLDSSASSSFYTTANESGFVDSAYVDSAVSGKMDISGMSSYATTAYVESGLSGKENVFSAGEGLEFVQSGSDRILQVEAPVDIVAGPGIVIDNPDGNTLRVSTDENYETVLWEGTAATSVTCSEAITNFERLKVYVTPAAVTTDTMIQIVEMVPGKFGSYMILAGYQSNLFHIYGGMIANSGTTTLKTENGFHMWVPITSGGPVGNESSNSRIAKVVGIHRIANN